MGRIFGSRGRGFRETTNGPKPRGRICEGEGKAGAPGNDGNAGSSGGIEVEPGWFLLLDPTQERKVKLGHGVEEEVLEGGA